MQLLASKTVYFKITLIFVLCTVRMALRRLLSLQISSFRFLSHSAPVFTLQAGLDTAFMARKREGSLCLLEVQHVWYYSIALSLSSLSFKFQSTGGVSPKLNYWVCTYCTWQLLHVPTS